MAQKRKIFRSNYWSFVLAREISIVLAIAWYIGVELLQTKQLPPYISHTGINRVPCLTADIQKQVANVYTKLFRKDDIVNKFYAADTGDKHLDGKVGLITSYDSVKCCFATKIESAHQMKNSEFKDLFCPQQTWNPLHESTHQHMCLIHQKTHA